VKTFLHLLHSKKQFGQWRVSDVLSRRMVLRNTNLPSGRLKNNYDEVDEAKFQGVEGPCELIFYIP
jgi:hypothetical protein